MHLWAIRHLLMLFYEQLRLSLNFDGKFPPISFLLTLALRSYSDMALDIICNTPVGGAFRKCQNVKIP